MSYARKGLDGSDVYVYATGDDYRCHDCPLTKIAGIELTLSSPREMLAHLEEHRRAGHSVPDGAIRRLAKEIEEEQVRDARLMTMVESVVDRALAPLVNELRGALEKATDRLSRVERSQVALLDGLQELQLLLSRRMRQQDDAEDRIAELERRTAALEEAIKARRSH